MYFILLTKACGKVSLWHSLLYLCTILYPFLKPEISYIILLFHIGLDFYGKGHQEFLVLQSLTFSNIL